MSTKRVIFFKCVVAVVLTSLVVTVDVRAANAETASCTVFEIRASTEGGGVDDELGPLKNKLKKPPFSSWKSFSLVKKHKIKAEQMKPVSQPLATGGKLGLLYKERSDARGQSARLRVGVTLDDASGKRKADMTLKVSSGDYTLVGRDATKKGVTHLLAIGCSVK